MCIQTVSKKYPNPEKERNPINGKSAYAKWISKRMAKRDKAMTPPASTEPMYLISESQIKRFKLENYIVPESLEITAAEELRARGPVVAQQAPEPPEICCKCEDTPDVCGSTQRKCEDAALIAQEREKWERERAEEHRTYESCHKHFACPDGEECWYSSADYYWDCGEGATRLSKAMAQAREDVLDDLGKILNSRIAKMEILNSKNPSKLREGILLAYRDIEDWERLQKESPRPGQQQEREKR